MSFILDALKKSEERRQQAGDSRRVRRRIMSYEGTGNRSWVRWLLLLLIPMAMASGWLLRGGHEPESMPIITTPISKLKSVQAAIPKTVGSERPSGKTEALTTLAPVQQNQTGSVQTASLDLSSAPVPRPLGHDITVPKLSPQKVSPAKNVNSQNRLSKVLPETAHEDAIKPAAVTKETAVPLYTDLSREVRTRMPRLAMSMHFYAKEPKRRLVRINDRLLRPGDWVDQDLQLVEVTPTGAVIDYMGVLFELRSQRGG